MANQPANPELNNEQRYMALLALTSQALPKSVRDELEIMQLVGAPQAYIRGPFVMEGVLQGGIGYDFASAFNVDKALVRLDYQGSSSAQNSFGPGKFHHALSLNSTCQKGRIGFYTDLLGGKGIGSQGDVWGVIFTPNWFMVEQKLQLVMRYQYAHGDNNGLKLQTRYESLAPEIQDTKGSGSDYNAAYLGLNWYLYGYRLRLMTGTEYSNMTGGAKSYSGWTFLTGLRLAF